MLTYRLTIAFSSTDLAAINAANENVTIVAGVDATVTSAQAADIGRAMTGAAAVAWLAFPPFASNQVSWSPQDYWLYATPTAQPQAIVTVAQAAAVEAALLPFAGGTFGAATAGAPADSYGVANEQAGAAYMAFGLALAAQVNGGPAQVWPLNVSVVPLNQYAWFSPTATVQVFLQTGTSDGMVLPNQVGGVTAYRIDAAAPTLALRYDSATASFVPA